MSPQLYNSQHLRYFEERLKAFKPKNNFEQGIQCLAQEAFAIRQTYSAKSIFCHSCIDPNASEDSELVFTMDKYIGIVADTKGALYTELTECLNGEYENSYDYQQPQLVRYFNSEEQSTTDDFTFEARIFSLIAEMSRFLSQEAIISL